MTARNKLGRLKCLFYTALHQYVSVISVLDAVLPRHLIVGPNLSKTDNETYIKSILKQDLPHTEKNTVDRELSWNFVLDKHSSDTKKCKKPRTKKTFLTRKERKELNLLKLPKTGWSYESLKPMKEMWKKYMRENLEFIKKVPKCTDPEWTNVSTVLAKSELIGAEVEISRSKVPSQVGIKGIIVLETKMTFQIVTPASKLKSEFCFRGIIVLLMIFISVIGKESSVFVFYLDKFKFTLFGKHLIARPSERSIRKVKLQMLPDL